MRYSLKILFVLLSVVLLYSCTDDAEFEPRDYPYVVTGENVDINATGVTIKGELFYSDKSQITDYGFILTRVRNLEGYPEVKKEYSLIKDGIKEDFSLRLTHGLDEGLFEGSTYICKTYVKGTGFDVEGGSVKFQTIGSKDS